MGTGIGTKFASPDDNLSVEFLKKHFHFQLNYQNTFLKIIAN